MPDVVDPAAHAGVELREGHRAGQVGCVALVEAAGRMPYLARLDQAMIREDHETQPGNAVGCLRYLRAALVDRQAQFRKPGLDRLLAGPQRRLVVGEQREVVDVTRR